MGLADLKTFAIARMAETYYEHEFSTRRNKPGSDVVSNREHE